MGNRAVITFGQDYNSPCIYLHWNGGRASIEGFLQAARGLGIRLNGNQRQTMDALASIIARPFFGNDVGLSVYREEYCRADRDNGDNGVYLLNGDMTIGGRLFARNGEEVNHEKTHAIYEQITSRAPIFNQ